MQSENAEPAKPKFVFRHNVELEVYSGSDGYWWNGIVTDVTLAENSPDAKVYVTHVYMDGGPQIAPPEKPDKAYTIYMPWHTAPQKVHMQHTTDCHECGPVAHSVVAFAPQRLRWFGIVKPGTQKNPGWFFKKPITVADGDLGWLDSHLPDFR